MTTELLNEVSHDIVQVINKSSKNFSFISVTGANNKSSVTYLIRRILQYLGLYVRIEDTVNTSLMEFTPTSLNYHRINMYDFDIGIFTDLIECNVTNSNDSIMKLFKVCELGIVNSDDPLLRKIAEYAPFEIVTYGINTPSDFIAKDIRYSQNGINFVLDFKGSEKIVKLNSFDKSKIYNALASIGTCYFLGLPLNVTIEALNHIKLFN